MGSPLAKGCPFAKGEIVVHAHHPCFHFHIKVQSVLWCQNMLKLNPTTPMLSGEKDENRLFTFVVQTSLYRLRDVMPCARRMSTHSASFPYDPSN